MVFLKYYIYIIYYARDELGRDLRLGKVQIHRSLNKKLSFFLHKMYKQKKSIFFLSNSCILLRTTKINLYHFFIIINN